MFRQRLVSILAVVAFFLTGGLGAGARVVFCTHTDGHSHLQMPFDRCCDDSPEQAAVEREELAITHNTPDDAHTFRPESDCLACSDQLVTLGKNHTALRPTFKTSTEYNLHLPLLVAQLVFTQGDDLASTFPACSAGPPLVAAHAPVESVVLRC